MLFKHGETFLVGGDRVRANSLHLLSRTPRPVPSPSRQDPARVWRQIRSPPSACRDLYKHTCPCQLRHSLTPGTYSLLSTHRAGTVCDIQPKHSVAHYRQTDFIYTYLEWDHFLPCPAFLVGSGDPNSGPLACAADTLPTEPSPRPPVLSCSSYAFSYKMAFPGQQAAFRDCDSHLTQWAQD